MAIIVQINIGTGNQNSIQFHNITRTNEGQPTSSGRQMVLSEAIEICERAAARYLGPPIEDSGEPLNEIVVGEQDGLAAAVAVLPRLCALQKALAATHEIGIVAGDLEPTPFMQKCLERVREAGE